MKLHERPSTTTTSAKRLGRGYGSGKGGHTAGRGQKGQKSRGKVPAHFVGTSWVWFKRLPFLRGKSRFHSLSPRLTLTLSDLNRFKSGDKVTKSSLYKLGLLTKTELSPARVKVVATGKLEKKLTVEIPATASAAKAIKQAGGTHRGQTD
jgi:large subunit ribosomal protein L15